MRRTPVAVFIAIAALLVTSSTALGRPAAQPSDRGRSDDQRVIEKIVRIVAGDHQVPGTFAYPKKGGEKAQYPAVLMLHGFGSSRDEVGNMYKREARALALKGLASLRIDFAGSGDSTQPFTANTYDGMMADTRAALAWLIAQDNTRDEQIGVLGFSLGGKLAIDLAGTDARVKALATWSGALENGMGSLAFLEAYRAAANAAGHVVVDIGFRTVDLSKAWFDTMTASLSLAHAATYADPLLAIAGSIDTTVNPAVSRSFMAATASMDETLRIIPGADHIYLVLTADQTLSNRVIDLTARWFDQKL